MNKLYIKKLSLHDQDHGFICVMPGSKSKILFFLCFILVSTGLYAQMPESMYFKFDALTGGNVTNQAPAATRKGNAQCAVTGHTITTGGQFGSMLQGTATANHNVNTGWVTNFSGSWTISVWLKIPTPSTTRYLFGDNTAGSFRCFTGGVATNTGITLRGPVTLDLLNISQISASPTGFVAHFVYDATTTTLTGYINGVYKNAVTGPINISSSGPFYVGNYTATGISLEGGLDEFRMYNRALSAAEVAATWDRDVSLAGAPNNASISAFVGPKEFCAGNYDVKVRLKNTGSALLNNVTVKWELDNIPQPTFIWNAPLDTFGGSLYQNDTVITLGYGIPFSSVRKIKVWTEFPNNMQDTVNSDDTITVITGPSLTGNLTIGGTNPDYADMGAAIAALNNYGVCGQVIFTVDPGTAPYNNDITFGNIFGASDVNTITFKGNGTTINTSSTNPTIRFNNASWVTLDSFNITQTGTAGFGVQISQQSSHITIKNSNVTVSNSSALTTIAGIVVTNGTYTADGNSTYVTIDNNTISGGYANISMVGSAGYASNYGHRITNNKLTGSYGYVLYISDADSMVISGNNIDRIGRSAWLATSYGIRVGDSRYIRIQKNRIHDVNGTVFYPIYLSNNVNSAGYETVIANNAIYNLGNTTTMYGIYSATTALTNVNIYHNTIQHNIVSGSSVIRGLWLSVALTNVNVKNNIISITGAGTGVKTGIYITTTSTSFVSNNNVIHVATTASNNVGYWSAARATLNDWRAASGQDILSVDSNPHFTNLLSGDLHPTSPTINNIGANVGITTDITGKLRSGNTPDPGAYETIRVPNDAATSFVATESVACPGSIPVMVRLKNDGSNIISFVTVNWSVNGNLQPQFAWNYPIDTIGGLQRSDTAVTIGYLSFSGVNPDVIKIWTSMPNAVNDTVFTNDTTRFTVNPGMSSGYLSIGPGGNYTTLTAASAAMAYGLCGQVTLELQANYVSTGETFPLTFTKGSVSAPIIIRPQTGATGLSITGSNTTAIIDLNGADYVTIDGRPGGFGNSELSVINTSTSAPAIRLWNDATHNTIQYATLRASNATAASGVLVFGTTSGTEGNSNNLVDHCNINGNSASVNCIYSLGTAAPADNKNNTVTNNNIYDFFANVASADVSGVALLAGNSNWNIGTTGNGNRFYQTAARTTTSTPALSVAVFFKAVNINSATVSGCNIIDNHIGGNIPGIANSTFVIGDAATAVGHKLWMIDNYASSTTVPNSIQNNVISDITVYSTVANSFIGIHGRSALLNVGNITGNTIGSLTGNHSIMVYHNATATNVNQYAIRFEAAGGLIQNNKTGSLSSEARVAGGGPQLLAIYTTGALPSPLTISNNTIGGSTPHSIQSTVGSVGNVNVMGICASGATGSLLTISNNTITNLSNLNSGSGSNNAVKGIYNTGASSVGSVIANNNISVLYSESTNPSIDQSAAVIGITANNSSGNHIVRDNTLSFFMSNATSAATTVNAIHLSGTTTGSMLVERNAAHALIANNANTQITLSGICIGTTVTTKASIINNMISLGTDAGGFSHTGAHTFNGILKSGGIASILHNTINLGGANVGPTVNNTFGYRSTVNTAGDSLCNNLFVNTRTNASTGGNHFALGLPNSANLFINSNLYYTSAAPLGLFNSVTRTGLTDWKASTLQDAGSVSTNVSFISHSDLHLAAASTGNTSLAGIPLSNVRTDFDNASRSATYPYMGADENSTPVPVKLISFTASETNNNVHSKWRTATERNTSHFVVEVSADNRSFEKAGIVKAKGNSSSEVEYSFVHEKPRDQFGPVSSLYYRLTIVDRDGASEKSASVMIDFNDHKMLGNTVLHPNPLEAGKELSLTMLSNNEESVKIEVTDINGKMLINLNQQILSGTNKLKIREASHLNSGVYLVRITSSEGSQVIKFIKE